MQINHDLSPDSETAERDHSDESSAAAINPRKMGSKKLAAMGFVKRPIMSVIRSKCIECCCGSSHEVAHCTTATCPLWPYRMGTNPLRAERSEAQKAADAAARERLRLAREVAA